jgi:RNA polymerase sigma factor (TIGR02999 family)
MDDQPITRLLAAAAHGDRLADDRLIQAVVGRLEQIASREMAAGNRGGLHGLTMEPRMLAHDALIKILDRPLEFENRRHFFAYATQVMARAIIDYQRRRNAQKRGGPQFKVTLAELEDEQSFELTEVPAALEELEALDPRKAELVGLRVFWGASMSEIADLLEISESTAERDWRFARRWLAARLGEEPAQRGGEPKD